MEFCDECGAMMKKDELDGEELWICPEGHRRPVDQDASYIITQDQEGGDVIESAGGMETLPETDATCPECGNDRAYWYIQQIRAADESETRFFVCTDCEHTWREDDN